MHRRKEGMMIRVTYVAEYENELDAPEIKAGMDCMDGKLVAVQFSDALDGKLVAVQFSYALREAEEERKSHESLRDVAQELIDDEAMHEECDDDDCLWCRLRSALAHSAGGEA